MTPPTLIAYLNYRLPARLKESGIEADLLIDWFENQELDKGLIAGFRKTFPNGCVLGAQLFHYSPNNLNYSMIKSEEEAQIGPHILLSPGKIKIPSAGAYTKKIPCITAPAFRYQYLWKIKPTEKCGDSKKQILVLLDFSLQLSIEILDILSSALPQIETSENILIKLHPGPFPKEFLIKKFGSKSWPKQFEIIQGNMDMSLDRASAVISAATGSIVEAAIRGIPIAFVCSQTMLNMNCLHELKSDKIFKKVYNAAELAQCINGFLSLSLEQKKDLQKIGLKIREDFCEPVSKKGMEIFLKKSKDTRQ